MQFNFEIKIRRSWLAKECEDKPEEGVWPAISLVNLKDGPDLTPEWIVQASIISNSEAGHPDGLPVDEEPAGCAVPSDEDLN